MDKCGFVPGYSILSGARCHKSEGKASSAPALQELEEAVADRQRERAAAAPPERLFTTVLMAVVALLVNSVNPSREEVRFHIERSRDPYFHAFLGRCMARVYARPGDE